MPPFDFPSVEQLLDEYIRQNQGRSLAQSPPAETPSGTDAANEATVAGLQQKKQELEQAQQMAQAQQQAQQMAQAQQTAQAQQQGFIDPVARQYYVPKLLGAKQLYASTADPNVRQQASALADTWRQEASNAGFDLSGLGADVSLEDAYRNLATNDARAAVDLTQGKFALRPEDYYQKTYREMMAQGYSAHRASRAAGELTQRYQADRYQYLNNMLNGYGFDDKVMTPYGRRVLGELFQQSPELANLYATTSASQKDEYNQENQMAQSMMNNQAAMDRLMQTYQNLLGELAVRHEYSNQDAVRDSDIRQAEAWEGVERKWQDDRRRYSQGQVDADNQRRNLEMYAYEMAHKVGYEGKEADAFVAQALGYPISKNSPSDLDFGKIDDFYKSRSTEQGKLLEELRNTTDEDTQQVIRKRLAEIEQDMNVARALQMKIFGIDPEAGKDMPLPDKLGVEGAIEMFKYAAENDWSLSTAQDAVKEWAMSLGASEKEAEQLIEQAKRAKLKGQ